MNILKQYETINQEIKKYSSNNFINLIVVTKGRSFDDIKKIIDLGHIHFGENRVQECIDKYIQQYTDNVPYTYWGYSICFMLEIKELSQKKSHVLHARDQKIKLLCEQNYTKCEYNGIVVFNNCYPFYKNHNFCKMTKKIPTVHSILNKN